MKAKVISPAGYSFDAQVVGKVFDVVQDYDVGVALDIKNTFNDGFWYFSKGNVELIEDTVSEHLNAYLYAVNPAIDINYDRLKQQMVMSVGVSSDTVLHLESVENRNKVRYKINNKKFTE